MPFDKFVGNSAVCKLGHSYDKSRDGYYNFLPPMKSSNHGDNREMVLARRDFLNTGAYLPLANAISRIVLEQTNQISNPTILDIGCGEGYYTKAVCDLLSEKQILNTISAFDISKDAVRMCAKRVRAGEFCVASAYHIPIADNSIDIALNTFSPLALSETVRVLKRGGIFVMTIPAEEHLFELKSVLYETPYKNEVADFFLEGLTLLRSERLEYTVELDTKEKISSLFKMTPYAYRTKKSDADRLFSLESLSVRASFIITLYKKI